MQPGPYFAYFFILIWVIVQLLLGRWMFKARPNKCVIEKYPKMVMILLLLPFGNYWKKQVEKQDIRILQSYQFRVRLWLLSILISLLIFYAYITIR